MIVTSQTDVKTPEFEKLLLSAQDLVEVQAKSEPKHYLAMRATDFEVDLKDKMDKAAKGGKFDGKIDLISGFKFPDIVANNHYGVEVKTTKQDHWKTTGNSILETTRVDNVEKIYMFFAKLIAPPQFRFKRYEDCLYGVAVTHSPRYLVDMDLFSEDQTIFRKMGLPYEKLRVDGNPIKYIKSYYRKNLKPGEDIWWLENAEEQNHKDIVIKHFNKLSPQEKRAIRNQAFALFPEILGDRQSKYVRLASWLVSAHGVVPASLRDNFSAGGQVVILLNKKSFPGTPRVIKHLVEGLEEVFDFCASINRDDLAYYWGVKKVPARKRVRVSIWLKMVLAHLKEKSSLPRKEFLNHLEKEIVQRAGMR